jgi:hypothetical protein
MSELDLLKDWEEDDLTFILRQVNRDIMGNKLYEHLRQISQLRLYGKKEE